ncbi:hypothetical protein IWQ60_008312 [Tieghemiomyces parasiticus]|uniref:Uncharacterized protein n=1 Tax=Tieghemiomyces parasiticus TaxID=78921 RepID=A0A9W8DRN2_9FUNG|nr:hypothetical protein IWQ60_008312 [Tieghemiomyces parasiticus]
MAPDLRCPCQRTFAFKALTMSDHYIMLKSRNGGAKITVDTLETLAPTSVTILTLWGADPGTLQPPISAHQHCAAWNQALDYLQVVAHPDQVDLDELYYTPVATIRSVIEVYQHGRPINPRHPHAQILVVLTTLHAANRALDLLATASLHPHTWPAKFSKELRNHYLLDIIRRCHDVTNFIREICAALLTMERPASVICKTFTILLTNLRGTDQWLYSITKPLIKGEMRNVQIKQTAMSWIGMVNVVEERLDELEAKWEP